MIASITGPRRESASAIHSNGRPSIVAARGRRLLEGAQAKLLGMARLAASGEQPRFDQQRQPLIGLAEHHRRFLALEHLVADGFAAHRVAVHLRHRQRQRLELGRDLQLVEGALPLPDDAEQLEEEDAQLGVSRPRADVFLQARERGERDRRPSDSARPRPKEPSAQPAVHSSSKLVAPSALPSGPWACTRR